VSRLARAALAGLPPDVARPDYDLGAVAVGVVHFGPGAFHRAHQAFFLDRMLAADPSLGICEVGLRSADVIEALTAQEGLYTLVEQDSPPRLRVIGAIREALHAPSQPAEVLARLTSPHVRFVTATVTEKGYCLGPDGRLDLAHPDVAHDLSAAPPRSLVGWLAAALAERRAQGLEPFTVLSCDNLTDNGAKLKAAVASFARAWGRPDLSGWIEAEARFPSSMVDSITPASDAAFLAMVDRRLGAQDACAVQREPFVQWVIEDDLGADAAAFAAAGVQLTSDVKAFEAAKLRLLNGAHSSLAYLGLLLGHATVREAMADAGLAAFVEALVRDELAPTLRRTEALDAGAYIAALLERFRNPAIAHQLSQIAWDGSQKLPVRLLGAAADALGAGGPVGRTAAGVAAWMRFVVVRARAGTPLVDPLADELAALGAACTDDAPADVGRFLALAQVFPADLAEDPHFRQALEAAYARLAGPDPRRILTP
jgi:fructuronate reductase